MKNTLKERKNSKEEEFLPKNWREKYGEKNNQGKYFIVNLLEIQEEINDLDQEMKWCSVRDEEAFNSRGIHMKLNRFGWRVGVVIAFVRIIIIIHITWGACQFYNKTILLDTLGPFDKKSHVSVCISFAWVLW